MNSEKQNFDRLLSRLSRGEELGTGGGLPLLQSAVKLLQYLKDTISRCATMSTGQTLVSLVKWGLERRSRRSEVKSTLSGYQKALEDRLPRSKGRDSFGDECVKFKKDNDRDYVCYWFGFCVRLTRSINTAAYIADSLPQLEQVARSLADEKVRESIDLQTDLSDAYYDTVSLGIKTLVSGEYAKVESVLYGMTSINWATFDNIGDQSGRSRDFGRI